MPRIAGASGAILLACLMVAGCGGDGDEIDEAAVAQTAAAIVERGTPVAEAVAESGPCSDAARDVAVQTIADSAEDTINLGGGPPIRDREGLHSRLDASLRELCEDGAGSPTPEQLRKFCEDAVAAIKDAVDPQDEGEHNFMDEYGEGFVRSCTGSTSG